jgi:hypothetical protein
VGLAGFANPYGIVPPKCINCYPNVPGPPACAPFEDRNGPLLKGNPLLDVPGLPQPGWFAAVDLNLVGPHVKNRLNSMVTVEQTPRSIMALGNTAQAVQLPGAELDWTVAPRFEVGYRLPEGFGEFLLGYRLLNSDGTASLPGFDAAGAGSLQTRLSVQMWTLDYANNELSLQPYLDLRWKVGVQLGSAYFDNQARGLLTQGRTSNFFLGAGPHAGLELGRRVRGVPGLALVTRMEGTVFLGRIKDRFEMTNQTDLGPVSGAATVRGSQATPWLHLQAGVSYTPPWADKRLAFDVGYDWEEWWLIGRTGDSRGDLWANGIFFRAAWNY